MYLEDLLSSYGGQITAKCLIAILQINKYILGQNIAVNQILGNCNCYDKCLTAFE